MLDSKLDSKLEKMLEKKLGFPVDQTPITLTLTHIAISWIQHTSPPPARVFIDTDLSLLTQVPWNLGTTNIKMTSNICKNIK